jgi:adenylate cyclase
MTEKRTQRRLAAILAADVVGYSRLMEADESGTLTALKARRQDVLVPAVAQHNGRIVKVMGDGVLVEFGSAVDAVQCAVELQRAFARANEGAAEARRIVLRIGINLGDVIVEGSDLYGDGVNVAARLEGMAEPGGIYVSGSVYEQVTGKLVLTFDDLSEHTLKNIMKPVRVYRAAMGGADKSVARMAINQSEKLSIAVLPFTNMSGDSSQLYLSDGVTEDIIIRLCRFKELKVAARTAAFRFQGDDVSSGDAARTLGVRYVVKGTALKTGTRIIISCQLLEAETGNLLWGERYDRETSDIFLVQDEVVGRIVIALGSRVVAAGATSTRRKPTESWSAYDFFLRGRDLCNAGNESAAEPFFAKAISLDPDFALAHAWHAVSLIGMFWGNADQEILNQSFQSANAALTLDPNEATAHHAAGMTLNYLRKFDRSLYHFGRAIELNPLDVNVHGDYANLLLHLGRNAEALAMIEEALKRDPYPPAWLHYAHGKILFFTKRFQEAIGVLQNCGVYHYRSHGLLAACYQMLDHSEAARHEVKLMRETNGSVSFEQFRATLAFADPAALDFFFDALRRAGFSG